MNPTTTLNPMALLLKERSQLAGHLVQAKKMTDELAPYRIGHAERELARINNRIRARLNRRKQRLTY